MLPECERQKQSKRVPSFSQDDIENASAANSRPFLQLLPLHGLGFGFRAWHTSATAGLSVDASPVVFIYG